MKLEEAKGPQIMMLVNSRYESNDALGQMLHNLWCADPEEIKYPVLRKITRELKHTEKGREHMCKIIDQLVMEGKRRGAQKNVRRRRRKSIKNTQNIKKK